MFIFRKIISLSALAFILLSFFMVHAKDSITITSDKHAEIDNKKRTIWFQENVFSILRSTGSNLKTDKLTLVRDATSDRLIKAEADGHVKLIIRDSTTDVDRYIKSITFDPSANIDKQVAKTGRDTTADIDKLAKETDHDSTSVVDEQADKSGRDTTTNDNSANSLPSIDELIARNTVITCDWAFLDRKDSLVELKGSIRIKSVDYNLNAEYVSYNYESGQGKITALPGEQVKIEYFKKRSPDVSSDISFLSPRQKIIATSTVILVNKQARKIVLQGKVVVIDTSDQSRFTSERAEIFFDEKEDVETIIANDNFSLTQTGRISKADRAIFEFSKNEITLIGNAYVKEADQIEVTGNKIEMFQDVKKGIIKGAEDIPVKMEIQID